jgi:hypothetical protein
MDSRRRDRSLRSSSNGSCVVKTPTVLLCQAASPPADRRIPELAEILAAGLIRLLTRKSSEESNGTQEILVDFSAGRSGPTTTVIRRTPDA